MVIFRGVKRSLLFFLLCTAVSIQWVGVGDPWNAKQEGITGAVYSLCGRNFVRHGFMETEFIPFRNAGAISPEEFHFYVNHPPLVPILVALSFKIFGVHEWAARLVPLLFSLGSLWMIYLLGKRFWSLETARTAAFIASILPIFSYYAKHVDVLGSTLLFFVLLTWITYECWIATRKPKWLLIALLSFSGAMMTEWDAVLLAIFFPFDLVFFKKEKIWSWRVWIFPMTEACFLLFFTLHLYHGVGEAFLAPILQALKFHRTSIRLWDYFQRIGLYALVFINPFGVILAISGCWITLQEERGRCETKKRLLLFLFGMGVFHAFFFPNFTWIHRHAFFMLTPAIAYAAAIAVTRLSSWASRSRTRRLWALLFGLLFIGSSLMTTLAIQHWSRSATARELGEFIRARSQFDEVVLTSGPHLYPVLFYADRKIRFSVQSRERFEDLLRQEKGSVRLFVLDKHDPIGEDFNRYLHDRYPTETIGDYLFFRLPVRR